MEREEGKVLYFSLLGGFSCGHTEEEKAANSALMEKTGRKVLSFLQYFIVNHGRNISSEELIGQFWADSSDPASLLRNMLFKARNLLKELYPEGNKLLVTLQSCYRWGTDIRFKIDVERFEELCLKARGLPEEAYCRQLGRAIELYKGDFLAGNDSEWARTLRQYYRTLYLDACRAVLPVLYKKEQWMEIISVCSQAYGVDFGQEDFTVYHMQALIALGQPGQAVERYQTFREKMLEEYEMPPTERIEQIYLLAEGLLKNNTEERDVLSLVCEMEEHSKAFFLHLRCLSEHCRPGETAYGTFRAAFLPDGDQPGQRRRAHHGQPETGKDSAGEASDRGSHCQTGGRILCGYAHRRRRGECPSGIRTH